MAAADVTIRPKYSLFADRVNAGLDVPGAGALAMHILMWGQGVAALATAFSDEVFIRREVDDMCAWLEAQRPGALA